MYGFGGEFIVFILFGGVYFLLECDFSICFKSFLVFVFDLVYFLFLVLFDGKKDTKSNCLKVFVFFVGLNYELLLF